MAEKITGYILLAVGIVVILISAISVYQVFTKQSKPVQLFQMEGVSLDLGSMLGQPKGAVSTEVIPAAMINETSNLAAHIFLMGFIASVGQKLASIGVQLVRPIVVKLNEQKNT